MPAPGKRSAARGNSPKLTSPIFCYSLSVSGLERSGRDCSTQALDEPEPDRRAPRERTKGRIMKNRKTKTSETIGSSLPRAAWFTTRALSLLIAACASPAYSQPLFQLQAERTGATFATHSIEQ